MRKTPRPDSSTSRPVVFDGMNEEALLEINTGGSSLTTRERRIRDAVLAKQVSWREFRVGGSE